MSTMPVRENVAAIVANTVHATSAVYDRLDQWGNDQGWTRMRASIYADQAGTLVIQDSDDATNWRTVTTQASVASTELEIESEVIARYLRADWVNSGGAPTTFCEMHTERVA